MINKKARADYKRKAPEYISCPRCYGNGVEPAFFLSAKVEKKCGLCKGTGKLYIKKTIGEY